MTYDSTEDTKAHIKRVQELIDGAREILDRRAKLHDASKLSPPEKEAFDRGTQALKGLTYGSDAYRASFAKHGMKDAIAHHYAKNSHHPEHYPDGIAGMSLLDLVEMVCDWKAAGERHADGSMSKSLAHNKERIGISDQLHTILINTAREMGWED